MIRSCLLLPLLLLCCLPAEGLPLKILAWDQDIAARKLAIGYGKESVEIGYMHPHARTEAIKVPAKAQGLRLEVRDRAGQDGKVPFLPLKISAGIKKPLLLILPHKESKTGLRVMILEDDARTFRWGTIRLLNITAKPLVFRWEKKAVPLPKQFRPVDVAPGGDTRNMEVMLYLKDNLKRPLYSAVWEHRDDLRQLVFVIPNPDPSLGPVGFKFISEHKSDTQPAER